MDYEKGVPKNLVQFSPRSDLAFTDTGVSINDNAKAQSNVLWSSERIEKSIEDALYHKNNGGSKRLSMAIPTWKINSVNDEYYPNGYKVYYRNQGFHVWRIFKLGWWLSWVTRNRDYFCDKCCNYMDHVTSTSWNDNPSLTNHKCGCSMKYKLQPKREILPPK